MLFNKISVISFLLLTLSFSLFAQEETSIMYSELVVDDVTTITVDKPVLNHRVPKAEVIFAWGVKDEFKLGEVDFTAIELQFEVTINNKPVIKTLTIEKNKPLETFVYDATDDWGFISDFTVKILSFTTIEFGAGSLDNHNETLLKDACAFTVTQMVDYKTDVRQNLIDLPLAVKQNNISQIEGRRDVQLSWTSDYVFPNYQVQLLKLYNTDPTIAFDSKMIADLDWSRAITIETSGSETDITLTVAGGTGIYAWRVRPVGTYYDGGIANAKNWGDWSFEDDLKEVTIDASYAGTNPGYFLFKDPDEGKNYIYNRVFTEENKLSEGISYANGLNQVKQTQTYSNENQKTIVTQSVQDYSGRPALQTLPVPDEGRINTYKEKFVQDDNNNLYTADNFDLESPGSADPLVDPVNKVDAPDPLKFKNDYYSDDYQNDPENQIPDAEGYPYTRTIFKNDGTERVVEQSGVGSKHKIGEKTVTTRYSKPSQDELIRVFGEEALPAEAVIKTETTDQNGVTSVTYTSNEGKVIATCLEFKENALLEQIDHVRGGEDFAIKYIGDKNEVSEAGETISFSSSTDFLVDSEIDFPVINYSLACPPDNAPPCFTTSTVDCGYELTIYINEKYKYGERTHYQFGPVSASCGNLEIDGANESWEAFESIIDPDNSKGASYDFMSKLGPGDYVIRKVLRANTSNRDEGAKATFQNEVDRIEPFTNIFTGWLASVKTEENLIAFFKAVNDFRADLAVAHENNNYTNLYEGQYEDLFQYALPVCDPGQESGCFTFQDEHNVGLFASKNSEKVYDFNASIDITTTPGEFPAYLVIAGGCCGPIEIPIDYEQFLTCYSKEQLRCIYQDYVSLESGENPCTGLVLSELENQDPVEEMLVYMEQILYKPSETTFYATEEEFYNFLTFGYTRDKMKQMLIHMLSDKYSEPAYTDPVTGDPVPEKEILPYECEKIQNCWKNTVGTYQALLDNLNENPAGTDANKEVESMEAGEEDGQQDFGTTVSEGLDDSPLKPIIKFIMSLKNISNVGNKAQDEANDNSDESGDYKAEFVKNFLNCAGYRFIHVQDPDFTYDVNNLAYNAFLDDGNLSNVNSGVISYTDDRNEYLSKVNTYNATINNDNSLSEDEKKKFLKEDLYIVSPVFAFKYFEYNNDDKIAPQKASVEIEYCYRDFQALLTQEPNVPSDAILCDNPCEGQPDVEGWPMDKRFNFYQSLVSTKQFVPADNSSTTAVPDDCDDPAVVAELQATFDSYESKCVSACTDNLEKFKYLVREMFARNCYDIGGCAGDPGTVTEEEIAALAQEMVDQCSTRCTDSFDDADVAYPTCDNITCYSMELNSSFGIDFRALDNAPVVQLMPACTELIYKQTTTWEPVVNLEDAHFIPSLCDDKPANDWQNMQSDCATAADPELIEVSESVNVTIGTQP